MQTTLGTNVKKGSRIKVNGDSGTFLGFTNVTGDSQAVVHLDGEAAQQLLDAAQVLYYGQPLSSLSEQEVEALHA